MGSVAHGAGTVTEDTVFLVCLLWETDVAAEVLGRQLGHHVLSGKLESARYALGMASLLPDARRATTNALPSSTPTETIWRTDNSQQAAGNVAAVCVNLSQQRA